MADAPKLAVYSDFPAETQDIWAKYNESMLFLQPRKKRQSYQLVLMNNLQRGDESIASTLLITLFNRTVANLYDDKMQVKFVPGEEMDQKRVASLNILAQNDYREMDMAKCDYDWTWDALFFGRGYVETLKFDPRRKIMIPHVINPLAFGYDPYFDNPQQWRYYWKWITKSSQELDQLIKAGVITSVKSSREIPSGMDAYLWNYKVIRERAKFVTPQADDSYQGDIHQILEFFSYDEDGDKCVYWLDKDFSKILYQKKLDLNDGEPAYGPMGEIVKTGSRWPIVVKEAFREPHSSVSFSVADLLEDKHRARSVLLNLAFLAAKDKANPLYQYNPDLVKDVSQLFSRQIYQHIPVEDVEKAIAPLNTDTALDPSLQAFMNMLNQEASDPIGTSVAPKTDKKGKQTATEAAIDQQLADMAQSLQSKVLQFGAAEFWSHWYQRYVRYSRAGDEKIATIVGVKGVTFEKIDLGEIKTKYPPGVLVFSAKEAEYKELVERRDMMQLFPVFQQSLTPDGMRNLLKYSFFPKFQSMDPQMIDIILPDTIDELRAAQENERLGADEFMPALPTDNHEQHLAVHAQASNTWAKWTHIAMHEELLSQQRQQQMNQMNQQAMQQGPDSAGGPQEPQQPQPGVANQNPRQAAASLQQETQKSIGQKQLQNL